MHLVRRWRLLEGISDSGQAAASPPGGGGTTTYSSRHLHTPNYCRRLGRFRSSSSYRRAYSTRFWLAGSATLLKPRFYCLLLLLWFYYQLRPSAAEKVPWSTMCWEPLLGPVGRRSRPAGTVGINVSGWAASCSICPGRCLDVPSVLIPGV